MLLKRVLNVTVIVILIVIVLQCILMSKKDNSVDKLVVEKYKSSDVGKIGEYSVAEFIERADSLIYSVYGPKTQDEYNNICNEYKDICTDVCLDQLSICNKDLTSDSFGYTVTVNRQRYGYVEHQDDGKRKLYYNITVSKYELTWDVNIEIDISNTVNKIDNIDVW